MLKDQRLHNYKFKEFCPLGYNDSDFREDLNSLGGYVNYTVFEGKDGNMHRRYELNELGKLYEEEFSDEIEERTKRGYKKLEKVGKLLSDLKNTSVRLNELSEKTTST